MFSEQSPAPSHNKFPHTVFSAEKDVKNEMEKGLTAQFLLATRNTCGEPSQTHGYCTSHFNAFCEGIFLRGLDMDKRRGTGSFTIRAPTHLKVE